MFNVRERLYAPLRQGLALKQESHTKHKAAAALEQYCYCSTAPLLPLLHSVRLLQSVKEREKQQATLLGQPW